MITKIFSFLLFFLMALIAAKKIVVTVWTLPDFMTLQYGTPLRLIWTFMPALFWWGVFRWTESSFGNRVRLPGHVPIFAALAFAELILAAINFPSLQIGPWVTRSVIALCGIGMIFALFSLRKTSLEVRSKQIWWGALPLMGVALLWLWNFRPPADGDEVYFWYNSSELLNRSGITTYIRDFHLRRYDPSYPFFAIALSFFGGMDNFGFLALPWIYGTSLLALLFSGHLPKKKSTAIALGLVSSVVWIAGHSWFYRLFFQLWYGEALAILAITSFFAITNAPSVSRHEKTAWALINAIIPAGIGIFAASSKPPLSYLFTPLAIGYLMTKLILVQSKSMRMTLIGRVGLALLFGYLFRLFWTTRLADVGEDPRVYGFALKSLLEYDLTLIREKIIPYALSSYSVPLMLTGIITLLAIPQGKRFLAEGLFCAGLSASVLILYATQWKNGEYESSMRYLLHGMYGWNFYVFSQCIGEWIESIQSTWKRIYLKLSS